MWICLLCIVMILTGSVHPYTIQPEPENEDDLTSVYPSPPSEPTLSTDETVQADNTSSVLPTPKPSPSSYMAAILYKNDYLVGAGAVVGETWVLVTAFQMGAFKPEELKVRVGSNSAMTGGQIIGVTEVLRHPMFKQFNNDVALLKTAEKIVLNDTTSMIPLASSPPEIGDQALLLMWQNDRSIQLNRADILPISECRVFYPNFELTESNICAVLDHVLPFQVTLHGSPLVYNDSLVGLYMGEEANALKPSLCSNLAPLQGWVQAMMTNSTATQLLFPLDN